MVHLVVGSSVSLAVFLIQYIGLQGKEPKFLNDRDGEFRDQKRSNGMDQQSSDNGSRLINFATVGSSSCFPHKNIHKRA